MGKPKGRICLCDITTNIGNDALIPECPIPSERFDFVLLCVCLVGHGVEWIE